MRIDKIFGIKYPIFQGGMANVATGEFAAAVSNAGAMGIIGAGGMDTATLEKETQTARRIPSGSRAPKGIFPGRLRSGAPVNARRYRSLEPYLMSADSRGSAE